MNDCADNCPVLPRVKALEDENDQHRSTHREMFDRLRALETSEAVQNTKYDAIMTKLDALTAKLEALEAKPGKRWDGLVDKLIWAVAGAVVAFVLARFEL